MVMGMGVAFVMGVTFATFLLCAAHHSLMSGAGMSRRTRPHASTSRSCGVLRLLLLEMAQAFGERKSGIHRSEAWLSLGNMVVVKQGKKKSMGV